jgi:hypothetical protein
MAGKIGDRIQDCGFVLERHPICGHRCLSTIDDLAKYFALLLYPIGPFKVIVRTSALLAIVTCYVNDITGKIVAADMNCLLR